MTLLACQIFSTIAHEGSFARTAEQLHLTPSAISHAVSTMETECGFPLFTRTKSGVTMTAAAENLLLSKSDDYSCWKTRRTLGICAGDVWYYTVHLGWWKDEVEPFAAQWETLSRAAGTKKTAFLLGDFNSEADVRGEGYDLVLRSGWQDTYRLAQQRDEGYTVVQAIDGWRDAPDAAAKKRIDQIWCSKAITVKSTRVVFNGLQEPQVSDHAGVLIEL